MSANTPTNGKPESIANIEDSQSNFACLYCYRSKW
jgi:hypothetical protein